MTNSQASRIRASAQERRKKVVPVDVEHAGFVLRLFATLLDSALMFLLTHAVFMIPMWLLGSTLTGSGELFAGLASTVGISEEDQAEIALGVLSFALVAFFGYLLLLLAVVSFYFPLFERSRLQATPGKILLGIYVCDTRGARLGFFRALFRNLGKHLSAAPLGLGFLLACVPPSKQALHDMLASCYVCKRSNVPFRQRLLGAILSVGIWIIPLMVFERSTTYVDSLKRGSRPLPSYDTPAPFNNRPASALIPPSPQRAAPPVKSQPERAPEIEKSLGDAVTGTVMGVHVRFNEARLKRGMLLFSAQGSDAALKIDLRDFGPLASKTIEVNESSAVKPTIYVERNDPARNAVRTQVYTTNNNFQLRLTLSSNLDSGELELLLPGAEPSALHGRFRIGGG